MPIHTQENAQVKIAVYVRTDAMAVVLPAPSSPSPLAGVTDHLLQLLLQAKGHIPVTFALQYSRF